MRRRPILFALLLLLPTLLLPIGARAETPAERAGRTLQQGVARDRVTEGGRTAGGLPAEPAPATQALEADRRSLQPDVGRPEENGAAITGGDRAAAGAGNNPQR